jgi:hypothetical protein
MCADEESELVMIMSKFRTYCLLMEEVRRSLRMHQVSPAQQVDNRRPVKVVSLYLLDDRECSYEAGYRFIGSITCFEVSLGLKKRVNFYSPNLVYLLTL